MANVNKNLLYSLVSVKVFIKCSPSNKRWFTGDTNISCQWLVNRNLHNRFLSSLFRSVVVLFPVSINNAYCDTVGGRNPAPPGMYKTLYIMRYLPYQLVQDFVHQQYSTVCFDYSKF